jgi:hypothetical protein
MRIELWRLNTHDIGGSGPEDALAELARDILMGYYEADDRSFWPKPSYGNNAPQEVRIVNDSGELLSRYNVQDVIEDTRRELVAAGPTRGPPSFARGGTSAE